MMANSVIARAVVRCGVAAPLIGTAATIYGLYDVFRASDVAGPNWRTSVGGILSALAATLVLLVASILVAVLYGLGDGRGDDRGAA